MGRMPHVHDEVEIVTGPLRGKRGMVIEDYSGLYGVKGHMYHVNLTLEEYHYPIVTMSFDGNEVRKV